MYNDVDVIRGLLLKYITNCANTLCPERNLRVQQTRTPWITKEIIEKLNERDTAFVKAYNSGLPSDITHAKNLRTEAKRAVRNACADFIK